MIMPIEQYKQNILEVKKLNDLYIFNSGVLTDGIDVLGLLRAQFVFAASTLDQYIHQLILFRINDYFLNGGVVPISFSKLLLGLDTVHAVVNENSINDKVPLILKDIEKKLGWRSFQNPDKINEGLKMVCNNDVWDEVATLMNTSRRDIKERLSLIIKRRDSISHEADYDVANQCQFPINHTMTKDSVNFITTIVFLIDSVVFNYTYNQSEIDECLI